MMTTLADQVNQKRRGLISSLTPLIQEYMEETGFPVNAIDIHLVNTTEIGKGKSWIIEEIIINP
jgi:hypothetical protein